MSPAGQVLLASSPRQRLTLSARPIGEGGQATVFGVDADPGLVVKLYHEPTAEIERRLESMLLLAHPDQFLSEDGSGHPVLTWPSAMVQDVDDGTVIGYAMRRVDGPEFVPLGTLFNPAQRRQYFPDVSWRFLVGLARNLAGVIAALHDRDLVLGDISHANLVVSQMGYISFLDCDSIQFTDPRSGEHFPCLFLTAEYAPAELQMDAEVERSAATDDFSLAVLACRLLLVGDHPFMGIRLGGGDDDADAARNIVDGYSHLVRPDEMGLPPGTLDPGLLPPAVLELAQRAFGSGHLDPSARPSADEWFVALDGAMESTVPCDSKRYHAFSDHLPRCPWCARVQAGSPDAFPLLDGPSAPTLQAASPSTPATKSPPQWLVVLVVLAVLLGLALVLVVGGR
jgi:eukaryotic-like serine/threonine-protein kinase